MTDSKKDSTKKKMGRPPKQINFSTFEALCKIHCSQAEICDILKVTDKTLTNALKAHYGLAFSEAYKKFSAEGKMSLRRIQFDLAKKSTGMAIWLGKQWLGQRDEPALTELEVWKDLDLVKQMAQLLKENEELKEKLNAQSEAT